MSKKHLLILLVLYVIASVASYGGFTLMAKGSSVLNVAGPDASAEPEAPVATLLNIAPGEAKDQPCPINGRLYTPTEKAAWEKRRPLAVMIENHPDARPQSGLSNADMVFEALAEGGVTRYMAIVYCDAQASDVTLAPIRSARIYFMHFASGFNNPMYVHVGGANLPGPADALGSINEWGWALENDINQFSVGYPTFVRDYNRVPGKDLATEHTMVTTSEKLWAIAAKREWTNLSPVVKVGKKTTGGDDWKDGYVPYTFQAGQAGKGSTNTISYLFWTGYEDYGVTWNYDQASNTYKRNLAGQPDKDLNNDKQIGVNNVVVLFAEEKGPIDEKKHLLYKTEGTGDALIFQNGEAIKAKWEKKTRTSQLNFKDAKGKDIEFVRGPIWVSVVDIGTTVTY